MEKDKINIFVKLIGNDFSMNVNKNLYTALEEIKGAVKKKKSYSNYIIYLNNKFIGKIQKNDEVVISPGDIFLIIPILGGG